MDKTDILARIAAYKREEITAARLVDDAARWRARAEAAAPPRDFIAALAAAAAQPALIAEIKKASPSKGLIRADFDPPALARAYAEGGAACLSVLTDGPSFQGAPEYLAAAREASGLPVLRKDFMLVPEQVWEARVWGADAILVILAMVDDAVAADLVAAAASLGLAALVEVHDEHELDRALRLPSPLVGVNNRDLRTFHTDLGVTERLASRVPADRILVAESGITGAEDVHRLRAAGVRAILVGESLMRQADVSGATRALLSRELPAAAAASGQHNGSTPLGSVSLGGAPLGSVPLGSVPLGGVPLGSVPLGSVPLGSVPGAGDARSAPALTHLDATGAARMVNVGDKAETQRVAVAEGAVTMAAETLAAIRAGNVKKGDVVAVARIAGIMAAKRTADIIPLCHPIPLDGVAVDLAPDDALPGFRITARAVTTGRTGVEMEALTAVAAACLTLYDMAKALDRGMTMGPIRLLEKSGGRSGLWSAGSGGSGGSGGNTGSGGESADEASLIDRTATEAHAAVRSADCAPPRVMEPAGDPAERSGDPATRSEGAAP